MQDTCYDRCGDGKIMKRESSIYCDDDNSFDGDGCSGGCSVETGYTCSGGSASQKDTCSEICGDGLKMGQLECDDGNTFADDGCSPDCKVEVGWRCSGGNP